MFGILSDMIILSTPFLFDLRWSRLKFQLFCLQFILFPLYVTGEYVGKEECHPKSANVTTMSNFERFSDQSKYGIGKAQPANISFEEARKYCENGGMTLGMIKTIQDYKSIVEYLGKKDPKCENPKQMHLIGSYKLKNSSIWLDVDDTATNFQLFDALEPYNGNVSEEFDRVYSVIFCKKRLPEMQGPEIGYVYRDTADHFSYPFSIICQFEPTTPCYLESNETKKNKEAENGSENVKPLGNVEDREYFVGSVQETWKDAYSTCKYLDMEMMDFELSSEAKADKLYSLLSKFIKDQDLFSQAVSFFTFGKFSTLFKGPSSLVPFKWEYADEWRVPNETNVLYSFEKSSPSHHGKCMSVGAFWEDNTTFTFSPAQCDVVHWFVCHKKTSSDQATKGRAFKKPNFEDLPTQPYNLKPDAEPPYNQVPPNKQDFNSGLFENPYPDIRPVSGVQEQNFVGAQEDLNYNPPEEPIYLATPKKKFEAGRSQQFEEQTRVKQLLKAPHEEYYSSEIISGEYYSSEEFSDEQISSKR